MVPNNRLWLVPISSRIEPINRDSRIDRIVCRCITPLKRRQRHMAAVRCKMIRNQYDNMLSPASLQRRDNQKDTTD